MGSSAATGRAARRAPRTTRPAARRTCAPSFSAGTRRPRGWRREPHRQRRCPGLRRGPRSFRPCRGATARRPREPRHSGSGVSVAHHCCSRHCCNFCIAASRVDAAHTLRSRRHLLDDEPTAPHCQRWGRRPFSGQPHVGCVAAGMACVTFVALVDRAFLTGVVVIARIVVRRYRKGGAGAFGAVRSIP